MPKLYWKKWIDFITLILLIIGGLVLGTRGIQSVSTSLSMSSIGMILIGLSAIYNMFSRDYYLPFLGDAVYPCGVLKSKTPENPDTEVIVNTQPGNSVIYWAAESREDDRIVDNPWLAYGQHTNAGVTTSDNQGKAILRFRRPASYRVPSGKVLDPHVHYRVCLGNGMLGSVETVLIKSKGL